MNESTRNWKQLELFSAAAREVPQFMLTADEIFNALDSINIRSWSESQLFERKGNRLQPKIIGEYCSMFANTAPHGGVLMVGVSDDNEIEGLNALPRMRVSELTEAPETFCPDARVESKQIFLENHRGQEDFVIAFRIYYNPSKVVKTKSNKAFRRLSDKKRELSLEQIRELMYEKNEIAFEQEHSLLSYPDDFRIDEIKKFCDAVRQKKTWNLDHSDSEVLKLMRLGSIEGGVFKPTSVCSLLFAKDPRAEFPGSRIRFLRFEGIEERSGQQWNAVKDEWIEGTISEILIGTAQLLESQLRVFSRLAQSGKFEQVPEYPRDAWYEAVVNALAHRTYSNGLKNAHVTVKMFEDRLEVESPGAFMPSVNPDNIYTSQVSRNPLLMDSLYMMEYVRIANEGTRRMKALMEKMQLPEPEFSQYQVDSFRVKVTLRNRVNQRRQWVDSDLAELVGERLTRDLTEDERRVLNYVAVNGSVNVSQAQKIIQRSWPYSKKLLLDLVGKGLLSHKHRHGGSKGKTDNSAKFELFGES